MPVGARELLRHGPFLFFLLSRSLSRFASQIAAVAIGWQIYELTGSAFELGMVGLVQFLPTALLVFVAGHAADRFERKRVVQLCQLAEARPRCFWPCSTFAGWLTVPQIFIATFVIGIAGAFESPATAALLPLIAPQRLAAARDRDLQRRGAGRHHHRPRARRAGLCVRAEPAVRRHGRCSGWSARS